MAGVMAQRPKYNPLEISRVHGVDTAAVVSTIILDLSVPEEREFGQI